METSNNLEAEARQFDMVQCSNLCDDTTITDDSDSIQYKNITLLMILTVFSTADDSDSIQQAKITLLMIVTVFDTQKLHN